MGKIFQKNIEAADGTIEIAQEAVESLLRTERWQPESASDAAGEEASAESLKALYEVPHLEVKSIDVERLTFLSSEDIIDRFLRTEPRRIVAEEGEVEQEITTSADIDDEEDMVSEELAEVYLAQGLKDMAKETYRKLSLLNPEKSVYFAQIIANIDSNN
ncbi:MAG: hypothetical protein Q4F42_07335 [Rikenellaceae bacterium]|nr:hypothetical protein [Rikenellaceae bacterium]